jgi:metal-sulfur cluster biosynthetic enzyme/nitrite reductase/ring-hydroxylating ferredoxin subunit
MSEFHKIASLMELAGTGQKAALIDGVPALLIRTEDATYHAIEDNCTHATKPLAGGEVTGNEIECPFHGAKFDIKTGEALCLPASASIGIFEVEVRDDEIYARKKPVETLPVTELPVVEEKAISAAVNTNSAEGTDDAGNSGNESGEPSLLDALKEVIDPELMVNIVDLGLIYEVSNDDGHVKVDMTLTSPACPVGPQLVQQAKMSLEKLSSVTDAEINLVMSPPWSPERMTDDARDQLGMF